MSCKGQIEEGKTSRETGEGTRLDKMRTEAKELKIWGRQRVGSGSFGFLIFGVMLGWNLGPLHPKHVL